MCRTRDVSNFVNSGHKKYKALSDIVSSPPVPGLHSLKINYRWFDFLFEDRGHPVTFVTFTAAVPADSGTYPMFSGVNLARNLGLNLLAFSDVAIGGPEALTTYWHLSTRAVPVLQMTPKIITHINEHTSGQNLLFFGSSAGGFAALNYSRFFPGSAVFVMNPRINVLTRPNRFEDFTLKTHARRDPRRVARALPTNMAYQYRESCGNNIFYMQNTEDKTYMKYHYHYFAEAVQGRPDVQFLMGDWGPGHVVPPHALYSGLLKQLSASAPDWALTYSSRELA